MRLLFSIIFSIIVTTAFSQEKQIKKSRKLYEKGKYEKCISKTKKYLQKHRRNADLQYHIVLSNIALYDEKPDSKKIYQLSKVLKSWDRFNQYSKENTNYVELKNSIRILVYKELENPKIKAKKEDQLHIQLAENFGDTTDYFRNKYVKAVVKTEVQTEPGPVSDSLLELDSLRKVLLQSGLKQLGVSYKYGGIDSTGFDCSGFTQYLYKNIGIELPHNAQLQSELGESIELEEAQTGDLIFFGERRAAHAGMIYVNQIGEIELIHCVSRGVSHDTDQDNNHIYWMNRPYRIKRFLDYNHLLKNE